MVHLYMLIGGILFLLLGVAMIVLIVLRMIQALRKQEISRSFACLALAAVCTAVFVIVWAFRGRIFATGFLASVERKTNAAELQEWATTQISRYSETNENVTIPRQQLPQFVCKIWGSEPPDVSVGGTQQGKYVALIWGSGFGHWGMYVGPPDLRFRPSESHNLLIWIPGIYVRYPTP